MISKYIKTAQKCTKCAHSMLKIHKLCEEYTNVSQRIQDFTYFLFQSYFVHTGIIILLPF